MKIRKPVVAGQFYSGSERTLLHDISTLIDRSKINEAVIGVISPHAGYVYSGAVAGAVLSAMRPRATYVIMGPNHTGLGPAFSISRADSWNTPLGSVDIDCGLKKAILARCSWIEDEDLAHSSEHSIEVQLPFLQTLQKEFTFVPIVIGPADIEVYKKTGEGLALAIKDLGREDDVVLIASSDMTHYEPHDIATKKDREAIKAIERLDIDLLFKKIKDLDISMCGYAPSAVMLSAAKSLGATKGRLIRYQTSAESSRDYSSVVGYAGIIIL